MRRPIRAQPAHRGVRAAALVLVPGVLVAVLAALVSAATAEPRHVAVGSVTLTQVAGNRPAYELNTFAADFETALAGPEVRRAVDEALPANAPAAPVEVTRLTDASRVTLSLTADEAEEAQAALLVAGRTAYRLVVEQQRELSRVRAEAARVRLDRLTEQVEELRQTTEAAPEAARAESQSLLDQQRQAVGIAVGELSDAEGGLAVAETIAAELTRSQAVTVGEVSRTSTLPAVLGAAAAGLLGGALAGVLLTFWLYRTARRRGRRNADTPDQEDLQRAGGRPAAPDARVPASVVDGPGAPADDRVRLRLRSAATRRGPLTP